MLFKFDGIMPDKLEFTCKCSAWTSVLRIKNNKGTKDDPQIVTCTGCNQILKLWQQDSHWHMWVEEKNG